ncbi:MAG: M20/M25/M40 family metallo-hydrolase [Methyloceanibacter sp.]
MLQHTDVVPADREYWTTDPLSGEIRDGYLWGRGTLDMKGTGISQLATFIRTSGTKAARSNSANRRPVRRVMMARTSDMLQ